MSLRLDAPGGDAWTVLFARATEGLSRVGEVSLVLASKTVEAAPDELFQARVGVEVSRSSLKRSLRGVVRRVEDLGSMGAWRLAHAVVAPSLWLLSLRRDARVFQGLSTPAIVSEVLRDAGLYQGDGELVVPPGLQALPAREYCVQYNETDLDFVLRILEDEGVPFRFECDGARESLVLVDETPRWPAVNTADGGPLRVSDQGLATAALESVRRFEWRRDARPTSATLRDFDFTHPRAVLDMTPRAQAPSPTHGVYEYPGRFSLGAYDSDAGVYGAHHGARAARVRQQELAASSSIAFGASNCAGLAPGLAFDLIGHARRELDARYVVTSIEHTAAAWSDVPDAVRLSDRVRALTDERASGDPASALRDRYENAFECVPATVAYRPPRVTPRPSIAGPQTAFVMAPAGADDEIATDSHGRVLVRFHWERHELRTPSQRGRNSSCWVRVAQSWAGAGWGTLFIPRVGMEVVVHFLEGDPDRPLVTGCVYNAENRPPVNLPEEKTRSTVKTSSSRGGAGFNELRFEDRAGQEQVFLHAQRDHDTVVRRDQTLSVGHDRVKTVEGSEHITVQRDRVATVERNDALDVGGNHTVAVHGSSGAALRVDASYVLSAQDSIALTVGDTSLVLLPDRATLSSRAVHVLGGELVNIYGGVTRINCEDGERDAVRALHPQAARSVSLQGTPGGALRRSIAAIDVPSMVRFAAEAIDAPMKLGGVPDRLRQRLGGVARDVATRWLQGLASGTLPSWTSLVEGPVSAIVSGAVDKVFSAFEPLGVPGADEPFADRMLRGLFRQVRASVGEAATSGLMHAMALDRGMRSDPFWGALGQRDAAGTHGALTAIAHHAATQIIGQHARRHAADGVRDALASWATGGVEQVLADAAPRALSLEALS